MEVQKFFCGQQHLHVWLKEKTRTDVSTLSGTSGKAKDQIQWCVSDRFMLPSNAKQL